MRTCAALCVLALVAGCGSSAPDPTVDQLSDLEVAVRANNRAIGVTTALVFTGVIDVNQPPESITSAIAQRFKSETGGCATVTFSGVVIDADLGAGCTLASTSQVYKGTVHTELQVMTTGEVVLVLTLNLTVDAQPLTGMLFEVHTTDGNVFTYKSDLTSGVVHVLAPYLRAGIGAFGASLDIKGTFTGKSAPMAPGLTLNTTGVHQRFAGCYPDDGTATLTGPMVNETITFASDAPQTGMVMLTTGSAPITATLPARMGCPQK